MDLVQAFQQTITAGQTIFDIGAFQGQLSGVFSALTGPGGRVVAFEPHPIHYYLLSQVAVHSPAQNITPYNRVLSNRIGHVPFFASKDLSANGQDQASTIVTELATQERLGHEMVRLLIESTTVDQIVMTTQQMPQFIKIDVEGAEELVFLGAQATIAAFHPVIVCESSFGMSTNVTQTYPQMLEDMGYELFIVDIMRYHDQWVDANSSYMTQRLLPISSKDFKRFTEILVNLLAIPRAKRHEYRIAQYVDYRDATDVLL